METYHGVPIPRELWDSWNGCNPETCGWARGVCDALKIKYPSEVDQAELVRLAPLAEQEEGTDD